MDDQQARNRHLAISLTRLAGAVLVVLGMVALSDGIALDPAIAWTAVVIGAACFFFVPLYLYRRWRSPKS